jgi:hypothetical protein
MVRFLTIKRTEIMNKLEKLAHRLQASIDFATEQKEDFEASSWNYQEGVLLNHNEAKLVVDLVKKLNIPDVSNCATSMEEILNEAQRRKAKHSVQYADYSLETWTVANDLLEHRKNALLADGSVRKVRIEYEM